MDLFRLNSIPALTVALVAFLWCIGGSTQTSLSSSDCGNATTAQVRAALARLHIAIDRKPFPIGQIQDETARLRTALDEMQRCSSPSQTLLAPEGADTKLGAPTRRPSPAEMWKRLDRTHQSVRTPATSNPNANDDSGSELIRLKAAVDLILNEIAKSPPDIPKIRSIVRRLRVHD